MNKDIHTALHTHRQAAKKQIPQVNSEKKHNRDVVSLLSSCCRKTKNQFVASFFDDATSERSRGWKAVRKYFCHALYTIKPQLGNVTAAPRWNVAPAASGFI